MTNQVQIYSNPEFGSIRTLEIDGEIWFVGIDVATALGFGNPRQALASHVEDCDKNTVQILDGNRGNPNITIINEPGLYALVMGSKLPSARRFQHWVTHDVLPSIRKTGSYSISQEVVKDEDPLNVRALKSAGEFSNILITYFEIDPGLARACSIDLAERTYNIDLDPVKKLLPTAEGRLLIASDIANHFNLKNARVANLWLEICGLQTRVNGQWTPTDEGKQFSTYRPYENKFNKRIDRQLMWEESKIIPFLEAHSCPVEIRK